jgi:hypothetical protein
MRGTIGFSRKPAILQVHVEAEIVRNTRFLAKTGRNGVFTKIRRNPDFSGPTRPVYIFKNSESTPKIPTHTEKFRSSQEH